MNPKQRKFLFALADDKKKGILPLNETKAAMLTPKTEKLPSLPKFGRMKQYFKK